MCPFVSNDVCPGTQETGLKDSNRFTKLVAYMSNVDTYNLSLTHTFPLRPLTA